MKAINKRILEGLIRAVETGHKLATTGSQTLSRAHVRRIYQESDLVINQDDFVEIAVAAYDAAAMADAERE